MYPYITSTYEMVNSYGVWLVEVRQPFFLKSYFSVSDGVSKMSPTPEANSTFTWPLCKVICLLTCCFVWNYLSGTRL